MFWESRSNAPRYQINIQMSLITIFNNVMERLFDELLKELVLNRFVIVSGSTRRIDGKAKRIRKAHLRRKRLG